MTQLSVRFKTWLMSVARNKRRGEREKKKKKKGPSDDLSFALSQVSIKVNTSCCHWILEVNFGDEGRWERERERESG